ncbi:hypothetical protein D3C80_1683430 [compost metagenome]
MHHQRFCQHRGQHQRYQRNNDRAPAAEGDQAQQGDRRVDIQQHLAVGFLDHDVGCRIDPGIASSQQKLAIAGAVFSREGLGDFQHTIQGVGLVVGEVGQYRRQGATGVEKLGVP